MRKKICLILGTRPEIIKCEPVIRELKRRRANFFVVHSGQHYSYNLSRIFYKELGLQASDYEIDLGKTAGGRQFAKMIVELERILLREKPGIVLVQGDTNTAFIGAFVASRLGIPVGHIEAGLRSYDRTMPEEINRVMIDHISDYLFAPTSVSKRNLLSENIGPEKIFVVGNTIVDSIMRNSEAAGRKSKIMSSLGLKRNGYVLATIHRRENIENEERLKRLLAGLEGAQKLLKVPVIFPIHPHTVKKISQFGFHVGKSIKLIEPLGFYDFLRLEQNARMVLTDSGGVQEEACILHVPCVTLRYNTERPETVEVGANVLVGTEPKKLADGVKAMDRSKRRWRVPIGDGKSGKAIVYVLLKD